MVFFCQSFEETIKSADENAFIYCDPPYIGRHVDYYDSWNEELETLLAETLKDSNAKFMLSTWDHNDYRENEYIEKLWTFCNKITQEHFYHVGAKETNRKPMIEALLMNYVTTGNVNEITNQDKQMSIFDFDYAVSI